MSWIQVGLAVAAAYSAKRAGDKQQEAINSASVRGAEARGEVGRRARQRIGEVEGFAGRYAPQAQLDAATADAADFQKERSGIVCAQAPGADKATSPDALAWQGARTAEEGQRMSAIVSNLAKLDAPTRGKFRDSLAAANFSSDFGSALVSDRAMGNTMFGEAQDRLQRAPSAGSGWRLASSLFSTAGGLYGSGAFNGVKDGFNGAAAHRTTGIPYGYAHVG